QLSPEQFQRMQQVFNGPFGLWSSVLQQFVVLPIVVLLTGLLVWVGVGFILGRPLSYRLALEVAAWTGLIQIPAQLMFCAFAWSRETMRGVHVGFGLLLPETETPSRLTLWLGAVLDAIGPLSVWYVVVLVIRAATL